jgi:hypothetical protein
LEVLFHVAFGVGIPNQNIVPTLKAWAAEVERDFLLRNFGYAPFSDVDRVFGGNEDTTFKVDHRSFMGSLNSLSNRQTQIFIGQTELKRDLAELRDVNVGLREENRLLKGEVDLLRGQVGLLKGQAEQNNAMLAAICKHMNIPLAGAPPAAPPAVSATAQPAQAPPVVQNTANPAHSVPISFPSSLSRLTAAQVFQDFYIHQWYLLYENADPNQQKRRPPAGVHNSVKKTIKHVVLYLSLFLDKHVDPLPEGAPNGLSPRAEEWKKRVRSMGEEVYEKAVAFCKVNNVHVTKSLSSFETKCNSLPIDLFPTGPQGPDNFKFIGPQVLQQFKSEKKKLQEKKQRNSTTANSGSV